MNQLPSMNFFTEERMLEFWGYVRQLLSSVSPMVMLAVALIALGLFLVIIINTFKQAASKNDDDDDEIEVKHY
ncbi:hypothetical protein [Bacillus mesophilum]|uniref:Uncharacterized protein n=1 Tax=Bacillus mesophilum TaxID=1071718 RepID=A0A7V7UW46_9BACI|nr:hypothetical protein [Bacillus mesophilum]KAB2333981.1 hypothetical protein F7732_07820 [Bacillus mesophilum]